MLSRRHMLSTSLITLASLSLPSSSFAQSADEDPLPPLPPELKDAEGEEDFFSTDLSYQPLGKIDPGEEKKKFAMKIMREAPVDCAPIDVARYYRDLGLGKIAAFGEEGRPYARGWPRLYNPVVIEFFKATSLNPMELDGDATAWCAAFVNYCIARSRLKSKDQAISSKELASGTKSASSGSFRCFGKEVKEPKSGDIVVWALDGTLGAKCLGQGHVGFFDGKTGDSGKPYYILGGNQAGDPAKGVRRDGVIRKPMPLAYATKSGKYKKFHSFRTAEFL